MAQAKALSAPGFYRADDTLYLSVKPSGTKSWAQRIVIHGKRRDIGLGSFKLVSLATARQRAHENRIVVTEGRDPRAEKRKAGVPTFRDAAEETYQAKKARWRSGKTAKNWQQSMARYAHPAIGDMRVDQVRREDVLRILTPIWTKKPDVSRKLRQRMRAVFARCQAHGFVEHNPAGEAIDGALPTMPAVKANYRALPHGDVVGALDMVETCGSSLAARLAFRFLVLTATRSGEIRRTTWAEIDLDKRTWTIPATRMKVTCR